MRFIAGRLLLTVPVLFAVLTISFFATLAVPGDPLASLLPDHPTEEQYQAVAQEFGADRPIAERWLYYVSRTLHGDLGRSLRTRDTVVDDLGRAAVATFELAGLAFVITALLGVTLGIVAATQERRPADFLLTVFTTGGVAAPIFWTALLLQLVFYSQLGWLPAGGRIDDFVTLAHPVPRRTGLLLVDSVLAANPDALGDTLRHLILPASVLAYRGMGVVTRITRAAMLEVLRAPYMQTARSFGARERRLVIVQALPNALPPILTVLGLAFGDLLAGSILVEAVFNWPGLGLYTVQSISALDYPGVIGVSLLVTFVYVIANLAIDLLHPLVDPRLRSGAG